MARGELDIDDLYRRYAPMVYRRVLRFFGPLLRERDLDIECALDPTAVRAHFDGQRIEQVMTNLLGNAIRYSPRGGTIRVASARLDTSRRKPVRAFPTGGFAETGVLGDESLVQRRVPHVA